jgi:hypothetical protein
MKKSIILFFVVCIVSGSCNKESADSLSAIGTDDTGIGGSIARFTIVGSYLFTVDDQNLNVFDITNPKQPIKIGSNNVGLNIETIFARDSKTIFIGSQSAMYIYDVSNPLLIAQLSAVPHFRSCDPVVANQNYAFVTLNNEGTFSTRDCWGNTNQLLTYDVSDLNNVFLLKTYNLTKPKGLGLLNENLFVCDNNLLRWFDARNPSNLIQKKNFNISAHDIIPLDSSLILVGNDGITQLGIAGDSIWYISKMQTKIK